MKKLFLVAVMLMVCFSLTAFEISGSTSASAIENSQNEGTVIAEQEIGIDIGALHFDLSGEVDYTLADKSKFWEYEVGASYAYSLFTFGSTLCGEKDLELSEATGYIDFAYENVGFDVDVLLSLDETQDVFQGAEFSFFYNPGPVELRAGYVLTDVGADVANAPDAPLNGGLYLTAAISY